MEAPSATDDVEPLSAEWCEHHFDHLSPLLAADLHDTAAQALAVVREYVSSGLVWYPLESSPPLEGVVPSSWEDIVTEQDSAGEVRVNRLTYELSVLQTLRERVRTKEVWVAGAAHFRNPDDDLPRDFNAGLTFLLRRRDE